MDDGLEPAWNCSACRGGGALCDTMPPFFAAVQVRVIGYALEDEQRAAGRLSAIETAAAKALTANVPEAAWLVRQAEAARADYRRNFTEARR